MEEKTINPSAGIIKEAQGKVENKELNSLKLIELKKLSKQIGIKAISKLKKDSLINLIKKTISDKDTVNKTPVKKNIDTLNNKNLAKKELSEDYLSKYKKLGIEKINTKLEEVTESSNWMHKNHEIQDLIKIF